MRAPRTQTAEWGRPGGGGAVGAGWRVQRAGMAGSVILPTIRMKLNNQMKYFLIKNSSNCPHLLDRVLGKRQVFNVSVPWAVL